MPPATRSRSRNSFPEQHFTTPPPRYNDASLVKFLEESGIGRPSTYAPTINTLVKRYYVTRSGKQLVPTVLGKLVNDIMAKHFASLVSIDFTANMEDSLDHIEDAKTDWKKMLSEFYGPFKDIVDQAESNIEEMKGILDVETDIICEQCGRKMVKKLGKFGFFLACPGFPECRNSKPLPLGKCPRCEDGDVDQALVQERGGAGRFTPAPITRPASSLPGTIRRTRPARAAAASCSRKPIKDKGEKLICQKESCSYQVELLDETMQAEAERQRQNNNGTEQQEA